MNSKPHEFTAYIRLKLKCPMATPVRQQTLDAGPRGGANLEAMSALSTGTKGKIQFYKGDADGTPIGSHNVYDIKGNKQSVGMVQTWNQCTNMIMTSLDKPESLLVMDTEKGAVHAELDIKRQQRNWKMSIDSVTPMQKFEQYRPTQEIMLFGLGDGGQTVFQLHHDARAGENIEEHVIRADSHRKYKSYTFSCHAQTRGGNLVLGRTDGAVALYDAIMQSETASCVLDGMPGPVTSIDVSADGSMVCWTTPEFVFFTSPSAEHWTKEWKKSMGKPVVLQLAPTPEDKGRMLLGSSDSRSGGSGATSAAAEPEEAAAEAGPDWRSVKFDAGTAKEDSGKAEREIVTYCGNWQMRWSVTQALKAWDALAAAKEGDAPPPGILYGTATSMAGMGAAVSRHMTVQSGANGEDLDIVALEGEIVRSLRF